MSRAERSRRRPRAGDGPLAIIRHGFGRLSAREAFIALAIACACTGAAIAAMAGPAPGLSYGAEAAIAIAHDAPSVRADHYASAATLPQVISGARAEAGSSLAASRIAETTVVVVEPALRLVFVRVQEDSQAKALALANGLAERAVLFVKANVQGPHDGIWELGDFESGGLAGWQHFRSAFNRRPLSLQLVRGAARLGSGKLRVACPAQSACGPGHRVYGSFRERATYVAEGWVRSTAGRGRVTLLVGRSGSDVGISPGHRMSPGWRRLRAIWTPKADSGAAEVAVQTTSPHPVTFDVDGVRLLAPLADANGATGDRRGHRGEPAPVPPSASLVPAVPIEVDPQSPAGTALLGAGAGLLVALGAIGFAQLARRRRDALRAPAP